MSFIGKAFGRLVEWLDFPPPKPPAGVSDVHWEFLGDLLGDLAALSDTETEEFLKKEFTDEKAVRELAEKWILPVWARLTPSSRERVLHSVDYYLCEGSGKINRVFPSFAVPLRTSAPFFFSVVRGMLAGEKKPEKSDLSSFRENARQAFLNSLYTDKRLEKNCHPELPPLPERLGLILPKDLDRHDMSVPLELLKRQALDGTRPGGEPGLPCDAARWSAKTDSDGIYAVAMARFERHRHDDLSVSRITLTFSDTVGEGYLAGHPEKLVATRRARFICDRLGFLVRGYPVLGL